MILFFLLAWMAPDSNVLEVIHCSIIFPIKSGYLAPGGSFHSYTYVGIVCSVAVYGMVTALRFDVLGLALSPSWNNICGTNEPVDFISTMYARSASELPGRQASSIGFTERGG